MAFDLASITTNQQGPPRIVIYGVPGIGKTTLAAYAPKPVFLCTEEGLSDLPVARFPAVTNYHEAFSAVHQLATHPHDYGTLVIDTIDALEPMIFRFVCEQGGKQSISEFGWSKGFQRAAEVINSFLAVVDRCRAQGMAVVMIAHSEVSRFEPPDADPYDRYAINLHRKACRPAIERWADAILFANYDVQVISSKDSERRRAVGGKVKLLHTVEKPTFVAKNRYGMPPTIEIIDGDPAATWATIESYLHPQRAVAEPNTDGPLTQS